MKPTFVRLATEDDIKEVAYRLRPEDAAEVRAATGADARLILPLSARDGRVILAAGLQENDRAEILFGVDPIEGVDRAGIIWLVSTPVIYDYPVEFVMRTQELLSRFHEDFDLLTNFIDERNTRHIKWLRWMNFVFLRRVESYGAENRPFLEFVSYRQCA